MPYQKVCIFVPHLIALNSFKKLEQRMKDKTKNASKDYVI